MTVELTEDGRATLYSLLSAPTRTAPDAMRKFLRGLATSTYYRKRQTGLKQLRDLQLLDLDDHPTRAAMAKVPDEEVRNLLWIGANEQWRLDREYKTLIEDLNRCQTARTQAMEAQKLAIEKIALLERQIAGITPKASRPSYVLQIGDEIAYAGVAKESFEDAASCIAFSLHRAAIACCGRALEAALLASFSRTGQPLPENRGLDALINAAPHYGVKLPPDAEDRLDAVVSMRNFSTHAKGEDFSPSEGVALGTFLYSVDLANRILE